jgi:methionyl-tRNA formyltransferase
MREFGIYCKGERGVSVLNSLLNADLVPAYCVVENQDDVFFRAVKTVTFPVHVSGKTKDSLHVDLVREHRADFLLCAGYSKIFTAQLLNSVPYGVVNLHGGRLPQYRGASPIPWQIIQGERVAEANVLMMDNGIDTGPVLASERFTIGNDDTARAITDKVVESFARLVPPIVGELVRGASPQSTPQSSEGACHWTRRYPEDGRISWHADQTSVYNLIRGLDDPYPGAYFFHRGIRVAVWEARIPHTNMRGVPGRCVGATKEGPLIMTQTGPIELRKIQMEGSEITPATTLGLKYGDRVD